MKLHLLHFACPDRPLGLTVVIVPSVDSHFGVLGSVDPSLWCEGMNIASSISKAAERFSGFLGPGFSMGPIVYA